MNVVTWTEYKDAYEASIIPESEFDRKSLFEIEVDEGVWATIGRKRKGQHRVKVANIYFEKEKFDLDSAYTWWVDHEVRVLPHKTRNRAMPMVSHFFRTEVGIVAVVFRGSPKEIFDPRDFEG